MAATAKPMSWMDHTSTKDVVCPYCGDTMEDDGEWHEMKVWVCDECGNRFRIDADYTVTFTTRRIADPFPAEQPREGGE